MQIYNALQIKAGAKTEYNKMGTLIQPFQFVPEKEKDDQWRAWNLDWLEFQGMKQLRRNARRLMKNYKLARGIIDKQNNKIEFVKFASPLNKLKVAKKTTQEALEKAKIKLKSLLNHKK